MVEVGSGDEDGAADGGAGVQGAVVRLGIVEPLEEGVRGVELAGAAVDELNTPLKDQSYAIAQLQQFAAYAPAEAHIAIFGLRSWLYLLNGFTADRRRCGKGWRIALCRAARCFWTMRRARAIGRTQSPSVMGGDWMRYSPSLLAHGAEPGGEIERLICGCENAAPRVALKFIRSDEGRGGNYYASLQRL